MSRTAINFNNPNYQLFKNFIERNYDGGSKSVVVEIFTKIFDNYARYKDLHTISIEHFELTDAFINKNTEKFSSKSFIPNHYKILLGYINDYILYEERKNVTEQLSPYDFMNTFALSEYNELVDEEQQYDEVLADEIIPRKDYDYHDLIRNLEKNKNIQHKFNQLVPEGFSLETSNLQRMRVKIISRAEDNLLPITYKIVCTQCPNVCYFSDLDLVGNLRCNHTIGHHVEGHSLKTTNRIMHTSRTIYGYNVEIMEGDESKELPFVFYSFEEIDEEIVEVQCLSVTLSSQKQTTFVLALSVNKEHRHIRTADNILKYKKPFFLEDIYYSLKQYLQKYHGIRVRDDNKYIAYVIIFQLLANIFHRRRFYSFIIGKSGSGKSFWANIIPPLLTGLHTVVDGPTVSKNRFLGGTSHKKSVFNNAIIQRGIIGTHDFIVAEESTNALNEFQENNTNKINNLFSMIKLTNGDTVPITTQGTTEYPTRASLFLTGNLENINSLHDYEVKVAKKYRTLCSRAYQKAWPLFKSLKYYKEIMQDNDLSQAHFYVRTIELDNAHYILRLPPAEMARFEFFVAIDQNTRAGLADFQEENTTFVGHVHKDQIREELSTKFKSYNLSQLDVHEKDELKTFRDQIYRFIKEDFFQSYKQNFRYTSDDINTHVKVAVLRVAESFFLFQKQYTGAEYELTDADKEQFIWFMQYNYNTLSVEEAKLEAKPFFNNFFDFDNSLLLNKMVDAQIEAETYEDEDTKRPDVAFSADVFTTMEGHTE